MSTSPVSPSRFSAAPCSKARLTCFSTFLLRRSFSRRVALRTSSTNSLIVYLFLSSRILTIWRMTMFFRRFSSRLIRSLWSLTSLSETISFYACYLIFLTCSSGISRPFCWEKLLLSSFTFCLSSSWRPYNIVFLVSLIS